MNISLNKLLFFLFLNITNIYATEYHLAIDQKTVNITGKDRMGMTINGGIPGPTLKFKEGDNAVIYVTNNMNVETSVHWHGLLLPNYQDGVPYLNTPPIEPGETQKYEFPIIQSGTYWYHSHTMLQEQLGVYGSIVIEPKIKTLQYDKDLVLVLSDWTDENPKSVLKTLKRGSEWYSIKRDTITPLNRVISKGGLKAQLSFWRQRMPGADIADVYYPAFLTNGKKNKNYPEFAPGEKVRVRIINAGASSYFWLTFAGDDPLLVTADGINVIPVHRNKTLIAIAETYDFILTVPKNGKLEIRATSMDGSGKTSAFIGKGEVIAAPDVAKPDYIEIMKSMSSMDMSMGSKSGMKHSKDKEMLTEHDTMPMDHSMHSMVNDSQNMHHAELDDGSMHKDMKMDQMDMNPDLNYDYLRSTTKSNFSKHAPVRDIELNLTGNMWRYVWSMNGKGLSEVDKIKIKKGEVIRITMNNQTMMNHPMHLHGHFFRVLNKNGAYSPLKHTVNVAPMQSITLEFDANESGDWFFHCHVLYHMMSGMARVFSYGSPRDQRLKNYPLSKIIDETDLLYTWGTTSLASHMASIEFTSSNINNQFNLGAEYGWNKNLEADVSYEKYLSDYFRVYTGANIENENKGELDQINTVGQFGIRYLLPYFVHADLNIDHKVRPQFSLRADYLLFPRIAAFGRWEYRVDFGVVESLPGGKNVIQEQVWNAGAEVILSKLFSLMGSYDNRFGAGGGLIVRF